MKEKGYTTGLPTYEEPTAKPKSRRFALAFGLIASVALLQYYHLPIHSLRVKDGHVYSDAVKPACPQAAPLVLERNRELWDVANEIIGSEDFKWKAISLLAGAVNIPQVLIPLWRVAESGFLGKRLPHESTIHD
ncbi:hypothetical protein BDZ89DRAFT_330781 [Hymenopellis radicata]|nr:hypothetical protein BDZ89DRAFT_330781 [Hymenopellis radicata]